MWPTPKEGFPRKYAHGGAWGKWATSNEKDVSSIQNISSAVNQVISQSLRVDPDLRPSLEDVYKVFMGVLQQLDEVSFRQLNLILQWYDEISKAGQKSIGAKEHAHIELSKISPQVMDEEMNELENRISVLSNLDRMEDYEVATLLYDLFLLARFYLERGHRQKVLSLTIKMRSFLISRYRDLHASVVYPSVTSVKDIEAVAEYIGKIIDLLERIEAEEELSHSISLFEKDNVLHSAILLHNASYIRTENVYEAVALLAKARQINPQETIFDYFTNLWLEQDKMLKEALRRTREKSRTDNDKLVSRNMN